MEFARRLNRISLRLLPVTAPSLQTQASAMSNHTSHALIQVASGSEMHHVVSISRFEVWQSRRSVTDASILDQPVLHDVEVMRGFRLLHMLRDLRTQAEQCRLRHSEGLQSNRSTR